MWSQDRVHRLQDRLGHRVDHTGPASDRSLAADAVRHGHAAAVRIVVGRTVGWDHGTVGAAQVDTESGCGWHRSLGRTGSEEQERRSCAAGGLGRTGRAPVVGTGSVYLLIAARNWRRICSMIVLTCC